MCILIKLKSYNLCGLNQGETKHQTQTQCLMFSFSLKDHSLCPTILWNSYFIRHEGRVCLRSVFELVPAKVEFGLILPESSCLKYQKLTTILSPPLNSYLERGVRHFYKYALRKSLIQERASRRIMVWDEDRWSVSLWLYSDL